MMVYGKREISQIVAIGGEEYETAEDAARACLKVMEGIFRERCKFAVVGRLIATAERSQIPWDDPEAVTLVLGWYSTEGDAKAASGSLTLSTATGERFRVMPIDVFHGTAAEFHGTRKDRLVEAKAARENAWKIATQKWIEDRRLATEKSMKLFAEQEQRQTPYPCTKRTVDAKQCRHAPKCGRQDES